KLLCKVLFVFVFTGPASGAAELKIVCLGDSVTKAVRPGVKPEETFCVLLEKSLRQAGSAATVINSGVGGHSTADGLGRFERDVLAHRPSHVVIMFGLNDSWVDAGKTASRLTAAAYEQNLRKMLAELKGRKIQVILMTPNPAIAPMYPPHRNVTLK